MDRFACGVLLWGILGCKLAGATLDDLRVVQRRLLASSDSNAPPREALSLKDVLEAKGLLREWLESRMIAAPLERELVQALGPAPPAALDRQGYLGVTVARPKGAPEWLEVSADVGAPCGVDRSVYLYEWRGGRWTQRLAIEQLGREPGSYRPQNRVEVQISPPDSRGGRLVLATGLPPFCMSTWHPLYIRLFQLGTRQQLLLDDAPQSYLGNATPPSATLEPSAVRIEFEGRSIDPGILIRRFLRHYALAGGQIQRIEPLAFSPADFVEEWLTRPWPEISRFSAPTLDTIHRNLHKERMFGYRVDVRRCSRPSEWQVSVDFDGALLYFLVHDRGGNRYRILQVPDPPRAGCVRN